MTVQELINNSNTRYVDVRTPAEYSTGYFKDAVNIPLDEIANRVSEINGLGEQPIVFYCRSGNRSGMAVSYLTQQGYKNIYNGGGIDDLLQYHN